MGAAVLAVLAVLPLPIRDVYTLNLIIITVLFAGLSQAWNILGGYCGQISLGHALYLGIGAYVSTLLFVNGGVPPTLGMFAGGAVAGSKGCIAAIQRLRRSRHHHSRHALSSNWPRLLPRPPYLDLAEARPLLLAFSSARRRLR